jgi:hypothetical protein
LAVFSRLSIGVTVVGFIIYMFTVANSKISIRIRGGDNRNPFRRMRPSLLFLTGVLPLAICFLLSNWLMFGSPTITSYDRWQHFVNGQSTISSQRAAFSCSFFDNLPQMLFDQESGLLIGAPLILLAVAFGIGSFWRRARNEAALMLITSVSLVVLFTKYCNAYPGEPGNRYLMPVVALCAIPLGFAIANCFDESEDSESRTGE